MNKAIKWFKGTVTGEQALKGEGYKDIEVLIKIAKKEVFDDLKVLFPKTLQPLGTKKETMIPKWKAIKNIGILIDRLKEKHLGE